MTNLSPVGCQVVSLSRSHAIWVSSIRSASYNSWPAGFRVIGCFRLALHAIWNQPSARAVSRPTTSLARRANHPSDARRDQAAMPTWKFFRGKPRHCPMASLETTLGGGVKRGLAAETRNPPQRASFRRRQGAAMLRARETILRIVAALAREPTLRAAGDPLDCRGERWAHKKTPDRNG